MRWKFKVVRKKNEKQLSDTKFNKKKEKCENWNITDRHRNANESSAI